MAVSDAAPSAVTQADRESSGAPTARPPASPRGGVAGRQLEVAGFVVGCVLLLFGAYRVFAFVQDDAFITYRYAWNLRHGFGPVFNPGDHTEGYSCPLFMMLTSLLMWLP